MLSSFQDSKFNSTRTEDSLYVTKYSDIKLNQKQTYSIEERFIIRPESSNLNFHFVYNNKIDSINKTSMLLRNIQMKLSANNIEEHNKMLLIGKINTNNWDDLINNYINEIILLKENIEVLSRAAGRNRFRLDLKNPTFLILNSIEKTINKHVFIGKVKETDIRIAIIEDNVLRIVDFDGKIIMKFNLETHKQI